MGSAQAASEPHLGEITLFPYSFTPVGYALCDGSLISVQSNTALFSLLGTQFGGDGSQTFGLPDLRGASPTPGVRYFIATQGIFPSRP
nr:tail fiber protein [Paenibacillus thalictri]